MNTSLKKRVVAGAAALVLASGMSHSAVSAQEPLSAGAAHMQGAFFIWVAAATSIINEHVEGVRGTTLTTLGSTENLELLRRGRLDIGAAGSVPLYEAYRGKGAFKEPITSLRPLYVMYPDYWQIALRADSTADSLADLKGRRISLQVQGSGGYTLTKANLDAAGFAERDLDAQYLSADASVQAIKDGQIEGFSMHGGAPMAGFLDLAQSRVGLKLVSLSDSEVERILSNIPYYSRHVITSQTYPGLEHDAVTVGGVSMLVASESLSEEMAYQIVKALAENHEDLVRAYAPARYSTPENTVREGPKYAPLHPGAIRYFKEKGLM